MSKRSASTNERAPGPAAASAEGEEQVTGRRARWQELEGLIRQVDAGGLESLGPDGLERLAVLYRSAAADLARARSEGWPGQVQDYVNNLVARAHARIYAVQPRSGLGMRVYFFGVVPAVFRRRWHYLAASTFLTLAMALMSYAGVRREPGLARELLGGFAEAVAEFARSGEAAGHYFADQPFVKYLGGGSFSAFLFLHNLQVALQAFALGVTAGLGTLFVLLSNGMMIGVFLAIGANEGALARLLSVVAPHGALEIPAILIAGAGGLLMGHAIVNPGRWRRADALKLAGRDALALLVVSVPMFLAAGVIEGNLSPRFRGFFGSDQVRIVFALGMLGTLGLYLWGADKLLPPHLSRRVPPAPPWP
ncbi:MAG: stage II sporulation protein M [Armatimonadetes bacterium]|nr:stage II sporulation protein M [Armatimonadota bacterium]